MLKFLTVNRTTVKQYSSNTVVLFNVKFFNIVNNREVVLIPVTIVSKYSHKYKRNTRIGSKGLRSYLITII